MSLKIAAVLACLTVHSLAQNPVVEKRRAETIAKADAVFGQRYIISAGMSPLLYDEETETGPPDAIFYWSGSSYLIELTLAGDGTIARLMLLPEVLLYTRYWGDIPDSDRLSDSQMHWLLATADRLQPLGEAEEVWEAPDGCFQSGPNLYCTDRYELAAVSHYHTDEEFETGPRQLALRNVEIIYKQSVNGIVEGVRAEKGQGEVKIGGQWYRGREPGEDAFDKARTGALIRLVSYGCSGNEKVCTASPEESSTPPEN